MRRKTDAILATAVFLAAFALYLRTLAPSVVEMFDDSAELQLVAYQLGIAHPTGYPLYTLLGKLFTFLPFGDPAYRVNLMSAFWGAGAITLLYWVTKQVCDLAVKPSTTVRLASFVSAAIALAFASSPAFWSSATVAEVYTLNLFFVGLTLVLALCCGSSSILYLGRPQRAAPTEMTGIGITPRAPEGTQESIGVNAVHSRTEHPSASTQPAKASASWRRFQDLRLQPELRSLVCHPASYLSRVWMRVRALLPSGGGAFAFAYGLSLTHHRTMLLLAPAFAIYGLHGWIAGARKGWRLRNAVAPALLFVLPLALYLYLPLRGASVTSLDGSYENNPSGFLRWVTASGYGVFFSANPWGFTDNPAMAYVRSIASQFSWVGIAVGLLGLAMLWRQLRIWLLMATSQATTVVFAVAYRVADPEPFYLPSFYLFAIFTAVGTAAILQWLAGSLSLWKKGSPLPPGCSLGAERVRVRASQAIFKAASPRQTETPPKALTTLASALLVAGLFAVPAIRAAASFAELDRSGENTVLSNGLDILSQPIETGAAVVGIGGEITLLKYLQASRSLRPDLTLVVADEEEKRLQGIAARVAGGQPVYTTRSLAGLADSFSLHSAGPLIAVANPVGQVPPTAQPAGERFGSSIVLAGFDVEGAPDGPSVITRGTSPGQARPTVRLTLFWQTSDKVSGDYTVFVHVEDAKGRLVGQKDSRPVNGAYPTSRWRAGEVITDTYDVPLLAGTVPGAYAVKVGLYDASGTRLRTAAGANETTVGQIRLAQSVPVPVKGDFDIERREISGGGDLKLLGFRLGSRTVRPGDALEVHLLWQALKPIRQDREIPLWLVGSTGERLAQFPAQPAEGLYPMTRWAEGEVVRDMRRITIPADLADGIYEIAVAPDPGSKPVALAAIEVKGRSRVYEIPPMQKPLNAPFGEGITLLGFDLKEGGSQSAPGAGNRLDLTLYWQGRGKVVANLTVFVHLVGEDGRPVAQHDGSPQQGLAPTATWAGGEVVADRHEVIVPPGTPAGDYRILVGLYDPATGRRLSTAGADGVDLGKWTVRSE